MFFIYINLVPVFQNFSAQGHVLPLKAIKPINKIHNGFFDEIALNIKILDPDVTFCNSSNYLYNALILEKDNIFDVC
jgi:hypothetical protein